MTVALYVDGFARCWDCGAGREVNEPGTARVRRSARPCVGCGGGPVYVTSSAPASCESCSARAEVVLADNSTWCAACHSVAWRSDHLPGRHVDELAGATAPVAGDELAIEGDPYECPVCLDAGEPCVFHVAWAAGWDACAAFMAAVVNEEPTDDAHVTGGSGDA